MYAIREISATFSMETKNEKRIEKANIKKKKKKKKLAQTTLMYILCMYLACEITITFIKRT